MSHYGGLSGQSLAFVGVVGIMLLSGCQAFLPWTVGVSGGFCGNPDGELQRDSVERRVLRRQRSAFSASTAAATSNQARRHRIHMFTQPPYAYDCPRAGDDARASRVFFASTNPESATVGEGTETEETEENLTKVELKAKVDKKIAETNYRVGSKLMTISSFGPESNQSWAAAREKRRGGGSTSSSSSGSVSAPPIPADRLPEVMVTQKRLYEKRKWRLIGDNVFLGLLGTSAAWGVSFKAACSYGLGMTLGTAYLVLLSRFVESLGRQDAEGGGRGGGGGGGPARLALAGLLVLIVSKNKETFDFIPAVSGFLAYQIATLVQAIYTDFDDLEDAEAKG